MGQVRYCIPVLTVILILSITGHVTDAFILLAPPGAKVENVNNFTLLQIDNDSDASFTVDDYFQRFMLQKTMGSWSSKNEDEVVTLIGDLGRPVHGHGRRGKWGKTFEDEQNGRHRHRSTGLHSNRENNPNIATPHSIQGNMEERKYGGRAVNDMKSEYKNDIGFFPIDFHEEDIKMPEPLRVPRKRASTPRKGHHSRVKRRARASVIVRVPPSRAFRSRGIQTYISRPIRSRVDANVGVLVVADFSVYRQYMESNGNNHRVAVARIRRYYGMVFAMINERFSTIKDPYLSIKVTVSGILIAERRSESMWTESIVNWASKKYHGRASVDTGTSLSGFSRWLDGRKGLPEFDHAMVFTAYRLADPHGVGLGGMAYLEAVCDTKTGNAVSIVGDKGDFQSVRVATHELAHSLGATHDGESGAESCPSHDAFIMSSMTSHNQHAPLRNAFYFSPCSIRSMVRHLSKSRSSCVRNKPPVYYHYNLGRFPPGKIYSADVQCKLIFGPRSEFCEEDSLVGVMCGQLWCRDPNRDNGCRTNSYLTALPGTPCGRNGMCSLGGCVPDRTRYTTAATTSTTTPTTTTTTTTSTTTTTTTTASSYIKSNHYNKYNYNSRSSRITNYDRQGSIRNVQHRGRSNVIPNTNKVVRPSYRIWRPRRNRRHKYRVRGRSGLRRAGRRQRKRGRRKNRCREDKNESYCRGLIELNPGGCRRRAIRQYCCATCKRWRKSRRRAREQKQRQ